MTMRKQYLADLEKIRSEITEMGHKTVQSVEAAVKSLVTLNLDEAEASRQYEKIVDAMNAVIDKDCIITIATQAPAASDVRFIVSSLKIASEIERVADYANNIAKTVQKRLAADSLKPVAGLMDDIETLGMQAAAMLEEAVTAFLNNDADLASSVRAKDAEVNKIYKSLQARLPYIPLHSPEEQFALLEINNCIRYLERVADRATNVAEWVFYIATGFPAAKDKIGAERA